LTRFGELRRIPETGHQLRRVDEADRGSDRRSTASPGRGVGEPVELGVPAGGTGDRELDALGDRASPGDRHLLTPCRHLHLRSVPVHGASLTMIDRHYGHLARDGRDHAIRVSTS
jgi:hypothetical protein